MMLKDRDPAVIFGNSIRLTYSFSPGGCGFSRRHNEGCGGQDDQTTIMEMVHREFVQHCDDLGILCYQSA